MSDIIPSGFDFGKVNHSKLPEALFDLGRVMELEHSSQRILALAAWIDRWVHPLKAEHSISGLIYPHYPDPGRVELHARQSIFHDIGKYLSLYKELSKVEELERMEYRFNPPDKVFRGTVLVLKSE